MFIQIITIFAKKQTISIIKKKTNKPKNKKKRGVFPQKKKPPRLCYFSKN